MAPTIPTKFLLEKRLAATTRIGEIQKWYEAEGARASTRHLQVRVNNLEETFKEFLAAQAQYEEKIVMEEEPENLLGEVRKARQVMEETVVDLKANLLDRMDAIEEEKARREHPPLTPAAVPSASNGGAANAGNVSRPRLEPIKVPTFDGSNKADWPTFWATFKATVHNRPGLDNVERFIYLKDHALKGEAWRVVAEMDPSEENYAAALTLLKRSYDDKRTLVFEHLRALHNRPRVEKNSADSLRHFLDDTNGHRRQLISLGRPADKWDDLLLYTLVGQLDEKTAAEWEKENAGDDFPTYEEFEKFIAKRCLVLQRTQMVNEVGDKSDCKAGVERRGRSGSRKETSRADGRSKSKIPVLVSVEDPKQCLCCSKGNHFLFRCRKFEEMSVADRLTFIRSKGICANCLKQHPGQSQCPSKWTCRLCRAKHNTLVHQEKSAAASKQTDVQLAQNSQQVCVVGDDVSATSGRLSKPTTIVFATALIQVMDKFGNLKPCRALLDSCSGPHLISERLAQQLGLPTIEAACTINGIGGGIRSKAQVNLQIVSRCSSFRTEVTARIVDRIPGKYPNLEVQSALLDIPSVIELADPDYDRPQRVDMIIGAQLFFELFHPERRRLPSGPVMQKSVFGWVICGAAPVEPQLETPCLVAAQEDEVDDATNRIAELLEEFQRLEQVPEHNQWSIAETECEEQFVANVSRDDNGRFSIRLPFKCSPSTLGESRQLAEQLFRRLERRLKSKEGQMEAYRAVIQQHIDLQHLEPIALADIPPGAHYFIPHHGVYRTGPTSTPLRVVLNASARTTSGISLNDCLHVGRKIQPDLHDILIRSRLHPVLVSGDIGKMFMQIEVREPDSNFQLIVWRFDEREPLQYYRFRRLVFGLASSPYVACRCLSLLAEEMGTQYPLAAKAVFNACYMDNVVATCASIEEAKQLKRQLKEMLESACFPLHKWWSSHAEVIEDVPEADREKRLQLSDGSGGVKTLGLVCNTKDEYCFQIRTPPLDNVTKRTVFSQICRLFDPLGLVMPVVVMAKLLMQDLWREKINWDEALSPELEAKWQKLYEQLPKLEEVKVPRYTICEKPNRIEMHVFCDASQVAYGTAVYLRSSAQEGEPRIRLLSSKSKVAPISRKDVSIARLELCAALLGAEYAEHLRKVIDVKLDAVHFWSDSRDVLCWLAKPANNWAPFVGNRVAKIQQLAPHELWKHVPGIHNPADHASRGLLPAKLLETQQWWTGPEFLRRPPSEWPATPELSAVEPPEARKKVTALLVQEPREKATFYDVSTSKLANSFGALRRVGAHVARFIRRCQEEREARKSGLLPRLRPRLRPADALPPPLNADELLEGTKVIVRFVQALAFKEEIKACQKGGPQPRSSPLRKLNPWLDGKLLRVGGRLQNAALPHHTKHPLILPGRHPFTKALFSFVHVDLMHAGPTNLLANVRRQFWPLRGRHLASETFRNCFKCSRVAPRMAQQLMGALPFERVEVPPAPFHNTGVDLCGPYYITEKVRGRPPKKIYIAVFVCMACKAVHLELVEDLSTPAFLTTLRNFIGRRGRISTLFSDNMLGFKGAANELRRFQHQLENDAQFQKDISTLGIRWLNIPPRSPHQGGLWEAAVRQFKLLFKRTLGDAILTVLELNSLIIRCESVLNSRPLMPLSEDLDSLDVLSPGHFLVGRPMWSLPEPNVSGARISLLDRWSRLRALAHSFWQKWHDSYLHLLQPRGKWADAAPNLKVGRLVLISEDNRPPLQWLIGRIIRLQPGADGKVRSATVKTAEGEYTRAIQKLAPLPLPSEVVDGQEGEDVDSRT